MIDYMYIDSNKSVPMINKCMVNWVSITNRKKFSKSNILLLIVLFLMEICYPSWARLKFQDA